MVGLQEGLAIDLSQINSYEVDGDDATVTVGAGSTFGQFQNAIYDAGFMIRTLVYPPINSCTDIK